MGIDTVKLRSPSINEGIAHFLEQQCILRSGVDLASGEILYEITTGELEGSWDSRVSFRVMREDWVSIEGRVQQVACDPYILIEASLHKFFYGQNVYGCVEGFQERCRVFIDLIGDLMGADQNLMPASAKWQVRRVDWAEVYALTPAAITEFFRGISHCKFPRRSAKAAKYGTNAVYFPGSFTTLKLYHKGPEFKEHDRTRIRRTLLRYALAQIGHARHAGLRVAADASTDHWVEQKLKALQRLADNRLRVEVEIHADKLAYDFEGRYPLVEEMTDDYLKKIHDAEVFKLMREGKAEMETVRTHDQVKARLNQTYGTRTANSLFAFWMQLAARGEDVIRIEYGRSQFYVNRKRLVDAGVSWLSSDIFIVPQDTALPRGFMPLRGDARLCRLPVSQTSVFNHCPVEWGALKAAA